MGVMIDGVYQVEDPGPNTDAQGAYQRKRSSLRNWITPDGVPGPEGTGGFTPDAGRYHLYAAWNCPWAHRVLLVRAVLGLEDQISVSYALPRRTEDGWVFDHDPELGVSALHQVYARNPAPYTGPVTVPALWDRQTQQIVSNESADIVRMLGQSFDPTRRLCPPALLDQIDAINARVYQNFNNGVYRAGFARTQEAYDTAVAEVFETMDWLEGILSAQAYLCGDTLTEADLRLFPTLARFDVAYHYAFKCNLRKLTDYPALWRYARGLYHLPGVANTVRFDIYKQGYFSPSPLRNPLGIVPMGPEVDWSLDDQA